MKKNEIRVLGILAILIVVVMASGCTSNTSNSGSKTYNGFASFEYPSSWSIIDETESWVRFKTPNSEGNLVKLEDTTDSPVNYEAFDEKTIGNVTYGYMGQVTDVNLVSYVIRRNGKDFTIMGVIEDEDGYEMILKSAKF
jgi:hypothetical protein